MFSCETKSPAGATSVGSFETLAGVDCAAWDRLAPDDVFSSSGWLRTMEETALSQGSLYFVVREAGSLVAAAACRREGVEGRGMDRLIYGRFAAVVRALRAGVSPALICGTSTGLSEHVRVDPNATPQEQERWITLLIDAMEQFALANRMTLCFRNVIPGEGRISRVLEHRGYLKASEMPTTVMDVRWPSFAEYRRDLKRDHPATSKNISVEINRARRAGVVFRKLGDSIPQAPRLHAILDAHSRRLNGVPFPFGAGFVETCKRYLGDRLVVYVAYESEDPIGVAVVMRGGDSAFHAMVGVDIARGRKPLVYFNNSYNVPIEDAILCGVRRIYCGKLLYDVKVRRGFRLVELGAYVQVSGRIRAALLAPAFAAQRARIRRMLGKAWAAAPEGEQH